MQRPSSPRPAAQTTFGAGSNTLFGSLLDLRRVASGLGYHGHGLQRLTEHVLGQTLPKSRSVTMSNWESRVLTKSQVKYAALDVLVAGQVFRGLRLWHSSPSPCASCMQPLGAVLTPPGQLVCATAGCGKSYNDVRAYISHCTLSNHEAAWSLCAACGRVHPLTRGGGAATS